MARRPKEFAVFPPLAADPACLSAPGDGEPRSDWRSSLQAAVRDPDDLLDLLALPDDLRPAARAAAQLFPLVVPRSYIARMIPGDVRDPLLRQVLPLQEEFDAPPGFASDPVDDAAARTAPGLLQKYRGRALLIATGTCAVHCRYCFRRHYPYADEPRRLDDWAPALDAIRQDDSLHEVLLSGGDPLVLGDGRLRALFAALADIPHLRRVRIHSRLPIVLPDRVTRPLLDVLLGTRLQPVMVVHANHPQELRGDCVDALRRLVRGGVPTLNQAVLMRGVNDDEEALAGLCEGLIDVGVLPYYLHQLDRVRGAAHFEVAEARGRELIARLRERLPGYAVPRYVREEPGASGKTPLIGC
ncbi:MAG: EF-P beta-lysylation protein EpmB [Planctomyces sp.]|nr:EF-P beta-lysylation protein EpmB [Planctomyces sp.]